MSESPLEDLIEALEPFAKAAAAFTAKGALYANDMCFRSYEGGRITFGDLRALATALTRAKAALAETGWRMVPVEPTEAMCRAYFEASSLAAFEDFGVNLGRWDAMEEYQRERLREFGRAMLAAAPSSTPGAPHDE